MQKFNGSLIRQFPSLVTGNAAVGVQVTVFLTGTSTKATLYATNNTAGATLGNPLTTDGMGFYAFYAVDGMYRLEFSDSRYQPLEISLLDSNQVVSEIGAGQGLVGQAASAALQSIAADRTDVDAAASSGLVNIAADVLSVQTATDEAIAVEIPAQIARLGLEYPPIPYTSGLTLNSYTKTYSYLDALYIWGGALGTVTTGSFNETGWQPIQGDIQLRNDVTKGTSLIRDVKHVASVAALRLLPGEYDGQQVFLSGYYAGSTKGAGPLIATLTGSPVDDSGVNFAGPNCQWVRQLDGVVNNQQEGGSFNYPSVLQRGGFWVDVDSNAILHKIRDRVFLGAAADQSGKKDIGLEKSWVGFEAGGFMTYFDTSSQLQVAQDIGRIGISSASRTSDQLDNQSSAIPFAAYVNNDRSDGVRRGVWAYYGHAVSSGLTTTTFGMELAVCNVNGETIAPSTSYDMVKQGMTANLWLNASGETLESGVPATAYGSMAIGLITSKPSEPLARYDKGIVFQEGVVQRTTRGYGIAIEMPRLNRIHWVYDGSGAASGYIDSESTTNGRFGIVFANDGIAYKTSETQIHRMTMQTSNVNGVSLVGSDTGAPPEILARGSDPNVSLNVTPKGTGGIRLRSGDTARKIEITNAGIGFFNVTPVSRQSVGTAATDTASTQTLVNNLRLALLNLGLCQS